MTIKDLTDPKQVLEYLKESETKGEDALRGAYLEIREASRLPLWGLDRLGEQNYTLTRPRDIVAFLAIELVSAETQGDMAYFWQAFQQVRRAVGDSAILHDDNHRRQLQEQLYFEKGRNSRYYRAVEQVRQSFGDEVGPVLGALYIINDPNFVGKPPKRRKR